MPEKLICHNCEHPRESYKRCEAPGCDCECENPKAPSPETRRVAESAPFARGYRDALDKLAPDATRYGMQYVEEFTEYLNGYIAGSPPGVEYSRKNRDTYMQIWIACRSGKRCPTCRHALGGDGQCRVQGCVCGCRGRAELAAAGGPALHLEGVTSDMVNHPPHYTDGKIEVWDFIIDKKLDYLLGNVVKYVSRAGKKNKEKTLEDLQKARAYLDKKIAEVEAES